LKNSAVGEYLKFINTAGKEDLKKLKGIGDKRAAYIVELREESPFKTLDDLQSIGLSAKQVNGLLKKEIGEIF
jgi:kinesin family protein 22